MPIPGSIRVDTTSKHPGIFAGAGFIRYRLDSTVVDTILFPAEPERMLWHLQNKQGSATWSIPFMPGTSSTIDRTGRFVWGNAEDYRLIVSRTGLDTVAIFESVPGAVATIPDSLRQERYDLYTRNNPDLRSIAKMSDIPTSYPIWTTFVVDGGNNIWVLLPGSKGPGSVWEVFTSAGVLLGQVPTTFTEPWRTFWTRDRVYSLEEDDTTGSMAITVYRIDKGAPD